MIAGAVVVPHPPLAVAEIGGEERNRMTETLQAYEKAMSFLLSKQPDTLIIISPHATLYRDYFNVSDGPGAEGTFIGYGAGNVKISVSYDRQFTYELTSLLEEKSFPGGTEYDRERDLSSDQGTMVPLYFLGEKINGMKVVRIGVSGLSLRRHYEMGMYLKEIADRLHRRAVVIASGDLSHCQLAEGPYGFDEAGPRYDAEIMKDLGSGCFKDLLSYDSIFRQKAMECGHRSFTVMAGILDRTAVIPHALSHEAPFGVGYGVVTYTVGTADTERNFLDQYMQEVKNGVQEKKKQEDEIVSLARRAVEKWVRNREWMTPDTELHMPNSGVFVSLHEEGELRGCIGTMQGLQNTLEEEIIANAVSACSRDPRFLPVEEEELAYLEISVDVLGQPEKVSSYDELDVIRYGIICEAHGRSGVLLPDLEGVDTVEKQIAIACEKGNIDPDDPSLSISRFEVVRHV